MRIVRYSEERKGEWDAFVRKAKNSLFMFCRDYMDYHSDRFRDHSLLFYEEEELMALLPANEAEGVLYSHQGLTFGGLIMGTEIRQYRVLECMEQLCAYLRDRGFKRLVYKCIPHIYHSQPAEEDRYALFRCGAGQSEITASTVIKLSDPCKRTKGRKAQISRARREGVSVRLLETPEDYRRFMELEDGVLEERHNTHAVHSSGELWLLHSRFSEEIRLYGAFYEEKLIAGCVIFCYPLLVHTQYMAADDTARQLGALDLVIDSIISGLPESVQWLDFGISTEEGGRILNEGLIAQKESFGGRTDIYEKWELVL